MKTKMFAATIVLLVLAATGCKSGSTSGSVSVVPSQLQVQTDAPAQKLSFTIDATNYPWNPAGQMDVKIDGVSVGAFSFNNRGSSAVNFSCTPGVHSFRMEAAGTSIYCDGDFSVDASRTDFLPTMNMLKGGQTVCGLSVNGKS